MKKAHSLMVVSGIVSAIALTLTWPVRATPTLIWQTTFNCNDWNQTMGLGDSVVCLPSDGIRGQGNWLTAGHPNGDEITSAANNPSGGGDKGFRHWRGDGVNNNGGGINIGLPAPLPELWLRWYMRYQLGFAWIGGGPEYTKELYFDSLSSGQGSQHAVGWKYSDTFGTTTFNPSRNLDGYPGWVSTMRGQTGDGVWHFYEVHMKKDTNGANGVFEAWVDGVRAVAVTNVDWGGANFTNFDVGSNQRAPNNGGDRYTDYDDIALSVTGYIGSLSGLPPVPPSPPSNLRIVP